MTKLTTRNAFRVEVNGTITLPQQSGLRIEVRVTDAVIVPQQLGDFGSIRMSDSMASNDIEGDYERRCREIVGALRDQHPRLQTEIRWDSQETCSHCGLGWEVMTAETVEQFPSSGYPVGMPLCCDAAQAEFTETQAEVA